MGRKVTIVMYHYVRDLTRSRFPAIKGLSLERFRKQLEHIKRNFTSIKVEDILEALASQKMKLPENAILLTFDDGYSDHFLNVFPMLDELGMQGCFFPPAQAVLEHIVLDVNKIQFVLAAVSNAGTLLDEIFESINEFRAEHSLDSKDAYLAVMTETHRYDTHEVTVIKRLLQRELPEAVRTEIVRRLFAKHVTADESAFACELYMSEDQITCLRRHGMHIGSHGYSHAWLNHIPRQEQANEIDLSLDFLKRFGVRNDNWSMCYPYGGFNDSAVEVVRERKCKLGFTVETRIADLDADDRLTLPRIDTNDLPS
jgi:peptidoglycan/xylan/chitin deacetylase (PgdA/CDA1 family)